MYSILMVVAGKQINYLTNNPPRGIQSNRMNR